MKTAAADIAFYEASAQIIPILLLALGAMVLLVREPMDMVRRWRSTIGEQDRLLGKVEAALDRIPDDDPEKSPLIEGFETQRSNVREVEAETEPFVRFARRRAAIVSVYVAVSAFALVCGLAVALVVLAQPERASETTTGTVVLSLAIGVGGVVWEFIDRLLVPAESRGRAALNLALMSMGIAAPIMMASIYWAIR